MNWFDRIKQIGIYTGCWLIVTSISMSIIAFGVGFGGLWLLGLYRYTPSAISYVNYPAVGLTIMVFGIIFGIIGTNYTGIWIAQKYSDGNIETEIMKNDILYILEDRLEEIRREIIEIGSKKE
jgi:hypothetical protein